MTTHPRLALGRLTRGAVLLATIGSLLASLLVVTPALAASFTVTSFADTVDASPGNGVCADASSACTLRAAIMEANAIAGADVISLPAGTYTLTRTNVAANEDAASTGDLDVNDSLTIQGAGSGITIIQAGTTASNGIDKVLALDPICSSPINVTIDGVTIRYGRNTQPANAADVSYTGGGIDWCSAGAGGTFTLSNAVVSDNTNVNGYGGGLNVDTVSSPTTVNITNVTFANNQTLSLTTTANGGAINFFGGSPTVNITNSSFTGNTTANPTSGGGAIYFRPTTVGHLTITGSTFSNNTAAGIGGAIAADSHGAATTISVDNSSFSGNHATNAYGGAINLGATNLNSTPFSLTRLSITGNTAGQEGGGVYVGGANVALSKSIIVGNSAPTASGLRKNVDAATATATNNWWGCSTGPGAAPCDTASTAGGGLSTDPWYRDQLTAATAPLVTNQTTSLTASFLTNSAGTAVPGADLSRIIGRSVSWAATNGTLSSTQGTVQAAGTATGIFRATAAGTAVISARVDQDNTAPVSSNVLSLTVNKADTTAVVTNATSLANTPTVTGQPVVVGFSVTGASGNSPTAPTGSVGVGDGVPTCSVSVVIGQCTIGFATVGLKSITATYGGDANFNASPASASASHLVNKADTTTTITSDSPDPSVVGQPVTVHYGVTVNAPGSGTPTGNVTVSDGTISCTGTVAAGGCSLTFTSTGARTLSATYAGNANFNGSTSASGSHTVNKADTTTAITSDAPDPSTIGQSVVVNFSVAAAAPGAGTPTGNVTVSDGVDSCTATVADGTCTLGLSTPGSRTLTATYAGDAAFNGSTSADEPHAVSGDATTTSITSDSPDPSVVGQPVTVQYSVTSAAGTPTGNVTVSDGTVSCTGTVASGQCSLTFTSAGARSLTATYAGEGTFTGSTSGSASHTVNTADTTIAITSDDPDASVVGQAVPVTFSVAVSAPGSGTPTGNVTVSDGTISCTATVAAGGCSLTFTSAGARSLTATYAGDSSFNGATSSAQGHQVDPAATTTTITSDSPDPSTVGQLVAIHYSVAVDSPGAGTPSGNVTVSDGTISCTGTVAEGQCFLQFTSAGARSLTATYTGTASFAGGSSAAEPHTVNGVATITTITSESADPSVVGEPVTVGYLVSTASGTPTGNVTVSDGTVSCTGTVASGQCQLTFTSASAGSLTATYAGDSTFAGSTSDSQPHTVAKADTSTTITSDSPDPSTQGAAVTVGYSVTVSAPGAGTPTGNVTVSDGVDSCTGTVAAGQCSITLTTTGSRTLSATYAGSTDFRSSTSAGTPHTVNPPNAAPTAAVTGGACSSLTMAGGQLTVTLADADGDPLSFVLAANSNTRLVPNASVVVSGTGASRTIGVTAAPKKSGTATLTFNLSDGKVTVPFVVTVIVGTDKNETLTGTAGIDMIFGLNGTNTIAGSGGADLLCGGNGVDTLRGGGGNDILDGGNGNDVLDGGAGDDVLRGSSGADRLTGGSGADAFSGGGGTDTLVDVNAGEGDTTDGS